MKRKMSINILKGLWNSNVDYFEFSNSELFFMLKKRSFSTLEKVIVISLIEFGISIFSTLFIDRIGFADISQEIQNKPLMIYFDYIFYASSLFFILQFIYYFYKIDLSSSLNDLSRNILKTRKSVYNYVLINICLFNINVFIFTFLNLNSNPLYQKMIVSSQFNNKLIFFNVTFYSILIVLMILVSFFIWYVYRLLYFKLLDKLIINFEELNKKDFRV